jgi:hypothetical protein
MDPYLLAVRVHDPAADCPPGSELSSILLDLVENTDWRDRPLPRDKEPDLFAAAPSLLTDLVTAAASSGYSYLATVGRESTLLKEGAPAERLAGALSRVATDERYPIFLWLHRPEHRSRAEAAVEGFRNGRTYDDFLLCGIVVTVVRSALSVFLARPRLPDGLRWLHNALTVLEIPVESWDSPTDGAGGFP